MTCLWILFNVSYALTPGWSPLLGRASRSAYMSVEKHLEQAVVARSEALPVAVLLLAQARQLLLGTLQLPRALLGRRAQLPQLRLQVARLPCVRLLYTCQLVLHLLQLSLRAGTAFSVVRLLGESHV